MRQLVEGMTAGVILVDPSGAILSANPAAIAMHGGTKAADLGETADEYCQRFCLRQRNHHRLASRDYPIIQALILIFAGVYVVLNLLIDLIYVFLDPRIEY